MVIHRATRTCGASPILLRLLQPRIVERYLIGLEFDDVEPLEDLEGELFIIRGKGEIGEEKMRNDEPGPSNWKRLRDSDYKADDNDNNARSYPNIKKPKRYVTISEEEDESDELEDDKD